MDYTCKGEFLDQIAKDKPWSDPDMSHKAQDFYRDYWPEFAELTDRYRREEGVEPYGRYRLRRFEGRLRGETLITSDTVIRRFAKAGLSPDLACALKEAYHCLANFVPWPYALNLRHCNAFREFPDLMFRCLRAWYALKAGRSYEQLVKRGLLDKGEERPFERKVLYLDKDDTVAGGYLSDFGVGEDGWRGFCEGNYLVGSFVDTDCSPVCLIENHRMCSVFPKDVERWAPEFVDNAISVLKKRAEVLARLAPER